MFYMLLLNLTTWFNNNKVIKVSAKTKLLLILIIRFRIPWKKSFPPQFHKRIAHHAVRR